MQRGKGCEADKDGLRRAHEELERKVAERTSELEALNRDLENEISERRRAEELLMKSEHRFRALFDFANDAIFIIDLEGNFIDINRTAYERLGYTREEMLSMKVSQLDPPEYAVLVAPRIRQVIDEGHAVVESAHRKKDGTIMLVEINARTIDLEGRKAILSIIRDITKRKQSEAILQAHEKQLSESQRIAHIGSWEHNLTTGQVFWSDELFRILGFDPKTDPADFRRFFDMVHPDDQPVLKKAIDETVRLRKPFSLDYRFVLKNGAVRVLHAQAELVHDETGTQAILSGTVQDITGRKQKEEMIETSLKEKETLLRELYHRTKNNMQVITSLLNLQSRAIEDKKVLQLFEDTKNRIRSMALVHEKLYKAKNLCQVDLNDYIKDLAGSLMKSYQIRKNRISLNINVDEIPLSIDTITPLGLVINELMANSLKYAFPDKREGRITITGHADAAGTVELVFSDNGIGLPEGLDLKRPESLGLKMINILVESQLDGKVEIQTSGETGFVIRFKEKNARRRI